MRTFTITGYRDIGVYQYVNVFLKISWKTTSGRGGPASWTTLSDFKLGSTLFNAIRKDLLKKIYCVCAECDAKGKIRFYQTLEDGERGLDTREEEGIPPDQQQRPVCYNIYKIFNSNNFKQIKRNVIAREVEASDTIKDTTRVDTDQQNKKVLYSLFNIIYKRVDLTIALYFNKNYYI